MMLDPQADVGRRVWVPCRYCGDNAALYLLASEVNLVWVQCPSCLRRWWHDTGVGKGGHPKDLNDVA
ncbi:MAG TPA: hypothetical protein VIY28_02880 [Pseudonocardiaceae bacterium]